MAIPRNLANIAPHVNASSTELVVNDGGANLDFRVEGDGNANLIVADAGVDKVGIGTNTFNTNGGVLQVSNGISFPASQSACADPNTLDDYEEGTWTPVYKQTDGTVITTQSANAATFKYTKISNLVCLTYHYAQQTTNMTNVRLITGLPFSCETGVGFWFSLFPYGTAQPSTSGWEAQINNQAVQVAFVANQTLATSNNWVFTVTYFTTA